MRPDPARGGALVDLAARLPVRHFKKCRANDYDFASGRDRRGGEVGEYAEDLIEARDFEDGTHQFPDSDDGELAAVHFHVLHGFNEYGQP